MKYLISFSLFLSTLCQAGENLSVIQNEIENIKTVLRENHYAIHPQIVHEILESLMIIEFQSSWDQEKINQIDRIL